MAGVAIFGFWSTVSSRVCSCVPAGDSLAYQIGAHPVKDAPEAVRTAFLAKKPAGTSEADVMQFLGGSNHSLDRCAARGERTVCRINYSENFWGATGYEMDFSFDATRRLQDVRFARF
jgi:hypothetical protein